MTLADVDLTDLDRFANGFPHEVFTHLRRAAPVWFHPPTAHTPQGEGFWVLTRHRDIEAVAADGQTFSSQSGGTRDGGGTLIEDLPPGFAGTLLNMMDDPRHRRLRHLVTPAVTPRALARIETDLRRRAAATLDAVAETGRCNFVIDVAAELPLQATALLLGVPQEDRHRLFTWAMANLDYDDRDLGERSPRQMEASANMFEYAARLIEEKRRAPGDDMLSLLLQGDVANSEGAPEPVTDMELQLFFSLLVAAGSETTRNSLALGLLALIDDRPQWQALQRDRSLLDTATEEILRWASSTSYNRRTATRDVALAGQTIRAGDKVTL